MIDEAVNARQPMHPLPITTRPDPAMAAGPSLELALSLFLALAVSVGVALFVAEVML